MWKGALVLKGIVTEADAQKAIEPGVDGIIVLTTMAGKLMPGSHSSSH